jgi:hypothetical protein
VSNTLFYFFKESSMLNRLLFSVADYSRMLVLALPATLLGLTGVQAQSIDPGLWEFSTQMATPGQDRTAALMAQMQAQLKSLPPEARSMMDKQLAGMGVGLAGNGAVRVCMTEQDASSAGIYNGKREDRCTYSNVKQSGTKITGSLTCTEPSMQGQFITTVHNAGHFETHAKLSGAQGRHEMQMSARRVSSDCGQLRPMR